MIKIKLPLKKTSKEIENFFIQKGLGMLVTESKKRKLHVNEMTSSSIYVPELEKLHNLYQYIILNKRKNAQHIFYLCAPLLGKFNKLQIDFYK